MADTTSRFPLGLCIAATLATGAGLIISAAGWQWGAAPAQPDALQRAWMYVQIGWMWTWLLVWPAIALGGGGGDGQAVGAVSGFCGDCGGGDSGDWGGGICQWGE